jgi:hypothetical protein
MFSHRKVPRKESHGLEYHDRHFDDIPLCNLVWYGDLEDDLLVEINLEMTVFGVGPKLMGLTLACSIVPAALTKADPGFFVVTSVSPPVFKFLGGTLLALGIPLWLLSLSKVVVSRNRPAVRSEGCEIKERAKAEGVPRLSQEEESASLSLSIISICGKFVKGLADPSLHLSKGPQS